jgi:AcrR family transcriptional regulator
MAVTDTSAPARRMGPKGSEIWHAMLDAAEEILREDGYGALTSRQVAERIGVKQRLVYYYFRTMDDLIVETFRRLAERELDRLASALANERPLHELWDVYFHASSDTRLVSEFMALANRVATLREEVRAFIEESRRRQVSALSAAMGAGAKGDALAPVAAAIFATSTALAMHRETELGIDTGHAEVIAGIEAFIARFENGG